MQLIIELLNLESWLEIGPSFFFLSTPLCIARPWILIPVLSRSLKGFSPTGRVEETEASKV